MCRGSVNREQTFFSCRLNYCPQLRDVLSQLRRQTVIGDFCFRASLIVAWRWRPREDLPARIAFVSSLETSKPLDPAADLGMFSMFGRTGAPEKGGPTKGAANFCMTEIMGDPRVIESDDQKGSPVFQENWHLTHGRWWLSKKVASFFHEKKVCRPRWRVPHFFWTGPC